MIPHVKLLGYIAAVAVISALLAGVWYAGGSKCREGIATAQAEHEREKAQLRDRLAAEYAASQVELTRQNEALRGKINVLVRDIPECKYSAAAIDYINTLR